MSINGRRILVTGGSRGLGEVLCGMLVREGADVWSISRTDGKIEELPSFEASGRSAHWSVCDVSNPDDLQRVASDIQHTWGALDALVNNAGIWLEGDPSDNSADDISRLISINLTGAILATRAFVELLHRGQSPQVVNVGSLAALEPCPGWPVYAASKYGLKGFSDSISATYASWGIRVTLVNSGGIDTQLYVSAGYPENIHQPWMMDADVVAKAIINLLAAEDDGSRVSQLDVRKSG